MAVSLGASGLLSLLCPAAAHVHPLALAGVRLVMGLVQGPANPALYSVLSRWSPPDEMATLVTLAYSGTHSSLEGTFLHVASLIYFHHRKLTFI